MTATNLTVGDFVSSQCNRDLDLRQTLTAGRVFAGQKMPTVRLIGSNVAKSR